MENRAKEELMNAEVFRKLALSFPGTDERPHFERTSFRVKNKIFVTLAEQTAIATFKFTLKDQLIFCDFDKKTVYPVPNKWGNQGWTMIELKKVPNELVNEALNTAYQTILQSTKKR